MNTQIVKKHNLYADDWINLIGISGDGMWGVNFGGNLKLGVKDNFVYNTKIDLTQIFGVKGAVKQNGVVSLLTEWNKYNVPTEGHCRIYTDEKDEHVYLDVELTLRGYVTAEAAVTISAIFTCDEIAE